jgi:hypothetical protein
MALGCEAGHGYNFVSGDHINKKINIWYFNMESTQDLAFRATKLWSSN